MANNTEEIKNRLSITDVLSSYLKLEKAGSNLKTKCPFHNEKTPSFFVSPDRGTYYCFGCGAKGDIFSFVEAFEGLDFKGALKVLADRAGVKLSFSANDGDELDKLYRILQEATSFFESEFQKNMEAQEYIEKRGVKKSTQKIMRIGYAPDEWRKLKQYLKSKKFTEKEMLATGLIKKSEKQSEDPYYDVFRGRIIFPIADSSGRIVAFSGRILKDEPNSPKYLNSPETKLYNKSKILYGLDKAKQTIRKSDYVILVEGQMDLVMSYQSGFTNTIAVSGTAFNTDESVGLARTGIEIVKRLTKNIIVAFDSDDAGYKAILRTAKSLLADGMSVKIALMKDDKDPADVIKKDPKEWAEIIRKAKPIVEFVLNHVRNAAKNEKQFYEMVRTEVLPYIALHESSIEAARLVEYVSYESGIKSDALWADLSKIDQKSQEKTTNYATKDKAFSRLEDIERKLYGAILFNKTYPNIKGVIDINSFKSIVGEEKFKSYDTISKSEKDALITEYDVLYPDSLKDKEAQELLENLNKEYIKKKRDSVARELKGAERDKDKNKSEKLLIEYQRLSKELAV